VKLDLTDCAVSGGALPDVFVRHHLPGLLARKGLFAAVDGWGEVRRGLRNLRGEAGAVRVANRLLGPLAPALGYAAVEPAEPVDTREGEEDGGVILRTQDGAHIRAWALGLGTDLEAGRVAGRTYRASPMRRAQRVLLACRERVGLMTNGEELRLLLCDPTRQDSWVSVDLTAWRDCVRAPDSLRLIAALAGPRAASALPELMEAARLSHSRVTEALRVQAREAIEGFLNCVLQETGNRREALCARRLWADGLILVYRILFILKLESAGPEHGASFTASRLWREALSPGRVLAPVVRRVLDHRAETRRLLEGGLRVLFRACRDGLACSEMRIPMLGGALFDGRSLRVLEELSWGERGVAILLDRLLWTTPKGREREWVQYGPLSVEQLGHVYEALLELEPSIVAGRFSLRAGLGRKTTGSFYTPQSFVHCLVRETLGPLVAERGSAPASLLLIKVLDPAVGSGHFLVEACRFLGDALYIACRACDDDPVLHARIITEVSAYLPSRAVEGRDDGVSEAHARAICRRLVAVNCLYGVDRNPLAVELAKLSLWLETHAEGMPLTFLDHRVVHGDSLSGPFLEQLATLPVTRGPIDPLLTEVVTRRLAGVRAGAMAEVARLEASVGQDAAELRRKAAAKRRVDELLAPWRGLAWAWAGAVMLGTRDGDDEWLRLAQQVARDGRWPDRLSRAQREMAMAGEAALPWDSVFPEAWAAGRSGFDAVLGNPPWDIVQANGAEFRAEGSGDPAVLREYHEGFARRHRIYARLYEHQKGGSPARLDTFRVFAERNVSLSGEAGAIGIVVPSAFHSNEGAAGTRRLYFERTRVSWCLSFENRRRLFDIHGSFRFALLVARRPGPTERVRCGFYLHDLAEADEPGRSVCYDKAFIEVTGGPALSFLELRSAAEMELARGLFLERAKLGDWGAARGVRLGREMNITDDRHRVVSVASVRGRDRYVLHEGKTIHQFTDQWATPRYAVAMRAVGDKPGWQRGAQYYRLAVRKIARSTDERTAIAAVIPPGCLCNDTAPVERTPWQRPNAKALALCGVINSFVFDWCLRQKTAATVNLFILESCPVCELDPMGYRFIAHGALRLSCGHEAYAPLWDEQLGSVWREEGAGPMWPVMRETEARWALRAAMDAVVAQAFGLNREGYVRVLRSFSHRSFPAATDLCLSAFERLSTSGLEAFAQAADPYWDISLPVQKPCVSKPGPGRGLLRESAQIASMAG
jgi:hypothetical protein